MARIRTIKPEFWDDLKIAKVSRDSRLLYIGMWNFADDLGVIIGDHLWIKSKVFPFDQIQIQQFDKWMQELVKSGFISLFSHNGEEFYYLPNLTRHQVINRPNLDKVNVKTTDLEDIISEIKLSLNHHGIITDESHSGEERKGSRKGEEITPLSTDVDIPPLGDTPASTPFEKLMTRIKSELPNVAKLPQQLTEGQLKSLLEKYNRKEIWEILEDMNNTADLCKRYRNVGRTAANWLKFRQSNDRK